MNELEYFRKEIDAVDCQIIKELAKRFEIARRVANFKKQQGIAMMQPDRVKAVKEQRREFGVQHGLDGEFTVKLYNLIIQQTCFMEDEIIDNKVLGTINLLENP